MCSAGAPGGGAPQPDAQGNYDFSNQFKTDAELRQAHEATGKERGYMAPDAGRSEYQRKQDEQRALNLGKPADVDYAVWDQTRQEAAAKDFDSLTDEEVFNMRGEKDAFKKYYQFDTKYGHKTTSLTNLSIVNKRLDTMNSWVEQGWSPAGDLSQANNARQRGAKFDSTAKRFRHTGGSGRGLR